MGVCGAGMFAVHMHGVAGKGVVHALQIVKEGMFLLLLMAWATGS